MTVAKSLTPEQITDMLESARCPGCREYLEYHSVRTGLGVCPYLTSDLVVAFHRAVFELELNS